MDSPSRNPLLLDQTNDDNSSGDESNQEVAGAAFPENSYANHPYVKENYRRSSSSPTDRYNFAYIAFYILGM